jgi:hypothetical protein
MDEELQTDQNTDDTQPDTKTKADKNIDVSTALKKLQKLLQNAVYEEEDFKVRDGTISLDMCYDTKGTRDTYVSKIQQLFSERVSISGTVVKIVIQHTLGRGTVHDKRNNISIKKDRRTGKSGKSPAGDETHTNRRK